MKMEVILYTYNHKWKHNTTGRTTADIFLYAGTPTYNSQLIKENKINRLNKNRQEFEVNTDFRKAPLIHGKLVNPFRKSGKVNQINEDHYEEINRGHKINHYKTQYKKKKKFNDSKYLSQDNHENSNNP